MFCINCGVRLADTEKKCPLCNTAVYHPDLQQKKAQPLYPENRIPESRPKSRAFNGVIIIIYLIPLFISLMSDWQSNRALDWFGFAAGGILLGYVYFGLPLWFHKPNPVIFVPCGFAATVLYLLYINLATGGRWFMSFAFPVTVCLGIIVCAVVTLTRYIKKGRLYIWGGAFIAFGAFILLIEFLLDITFGVRFIGWSIYPLIVLALLGGIMIYLAINSSARETMTRKLFF